MPSRQVPIEGVEARAYSILTDAVEGDGTFLWEETTIVVVEIAAGGRIGLGYTYTHASVADLIGEMLAHVVLDEDALAVPKIFEAMVGRAQHRLAGIGSERDLRLDVALWDLKARLLDIPLADLLGAAREEVPIYGSGGFTTYSDERLREQFRGWVEEDGCRFVKMKIGADPAADMARTASARDAIGDAALMIDANGAFDRKEALLFARHAADFGVIWFEEPVSSDDLEGLRLLRDRAPDAIEVAAGEYDYEPFYFKRMMDAGAVYVLQADATRCCGYTGFLRAAALADAQNLPLSAHTAPALHLPVCCAAPRLRHLEWFHDHAHIERMLFDGAPKPKDGVIRPDPTRPGHGLDFKRADAERFASRFASRGGYG